MQRKLPLILTLCAWLLATGSQWDLVQTVAWAQMFADNVRTLPVDEALARTFSPQGRCRMCRVVAAAKQQQENTDSAAGGRSVGKTFLVYMPTPAVIVSGPSGVTFSLQEIDGFGQARSAPPLPPPRV